MKLKVDFYTKTILTLIAVGLFANVVKDIDFVTQAKAETKDPSAVLVPAEEKSSVIDVNIVQVKGYSIGYDGAVPVSVKK